MPTVSAALGCSPTDRVRRPQRDRKSITCRKITARIRLIAIGPWLNRRVDDRADERDRRDLVRHVEACGSVFVPDSPVVDTSSWLKNAVPPRARMLMTVPLMIWSALTVIDSQACSAENSIDATIAAPIARIAANGTPTTGWR